MSEQVLRLFVSSPGDVANERRRVDLVIERLNTEFAGRVRIETIRWETKHYSAHDTFQKQIPEAAECDVVLALFKGRLGTPLPENFPRLPTGEPYPSGTAYEVLTAIEARKANKPLPDIFVFRNPNAPSVALNAPDKAEIEAQWASLESFFQRWFQTQSGEFLAAFQTYDSTDDFAAKIEDCMRQWLARRGFVLQGPVWDRVLQGSPFPGLAAFEANRGSVFFGRDLAIEQSLERLRQAGSGGKRLPFLLVIGASGAGKSSLLRAGLLPRLIQPGAIPEIDLWHTALITPGPDPFLALAEALFTDAALGPELRQSTFRNKELLAKQLAGDVDTALAPLRDALEKAAEKRRTEANFETAQPARLALAIDQAERLFTEASAQEAQLFAGLLAELVRQNLAYIIMALRSDAYAKFQSLESLVSLREAGATFDLMPPSAVELEEIVKRPVAACHPLLAFEETGGHSLAALLVKDAKGGDALPLLQMTLQRLYQAEAGRGDGTLRFADYRGMDAAVTETANEALEGLSREAREQLPALVAGLLTDVAADPLTGAPMPIIAALDSNTFEASTPARKNLVDAFVDNRLLTTEGNEQFLRVRPTHEALLRIWPEAVAIVTETSALIRVRYTLQPMVREWTEASEAAKPRYLDLSPALLDGAQQLLARMGEDLPEPMRAFIAQAAAADAARRDRERQEQEQRLRDAQAIAAANKRAFRVTVAGLVAALVFATAAGGFGFLALQQKTIADQQRVRAEKTLATAIGTANTLVFDLSRKLRDVAGVPITLVKDIIDRAIKLQDDLTNAGEIDAELRRGQGAALGDASVTLLELGDEAGALASAETAHNIAMALAASDKNNAQWQRDLAASDEEIGDVRQVQGQLDAALVAYRESFAIRKALAASNESNKLWQRDLSISGEKIGNILQALGRLDSALAAYRENHPILEALANSDKSNSEWQRDLSNNYDNIGNILQAQGQLDSALAAYRESSAIRKALALFDKGNTLWQRDLSISDRDIGEVLQAQGMLDAALVAYRESDTIIKALVVSDKSNTQWQRDLSVIGESIGNILAAQGKLDPALAAYRESFEINKTLAASDKSNTEWQRNLAISDNNIGDILQAQGQLDAALAAYREGYAIAKSLATSEKSNTQWQRDLSVSDDRIGAVLEAQGKLDAALVFYRESHLIFEALIASDKSNMEWDHDLSINDHRIGDVLRAQGQPEAALAAYREGYVILKAIAASDKANIEWQRDLSVSGEKIGDILQAQGQLDAALAAYRESSTIRQDLVASNKDNTLWQRDLSVSDNKIGDVLKAQGHADTALAAYRESNTILKELVASDKSNMDWERDLLASDNKIGTMLGAQGKIGDAFDYFKDGLNITKELINLNPNNPQLQNSLSLIVDGIGSMAYFLTITKEFRKALDAADLAISSAPDQTWLYTNRAHALMFLGSTDEARALYLAHRGEKAQGDKSWETVIRENFVELRKAGLTNPLMDEIERAFAKKH